MNEQIQQEVSIDTSHGNVRVKSFCSPAEIRKYTFDEEFVAYAQYKSLYTKRDSLEHDATTADANVVLALSAQDHIVGFGVLVYPDPGERWAELGKDIMMEVKVIEVCRSWRSSAVAKEILRGLITHPLIETKIAYMVGYSWTWDLDYSKLKAHEYRQLLIKLFESCGFSEFETNEQNICMKHENVFMCRIGQQVEEEVVQSFNWLRFGITPDEPVSAPARQFIQSETELPRSLFIPLIEEQLTYLGIYYDWKTDLLTFRAAREWERDVPWEQYNEKFTLVDPLSSNTVYLGHEDTVHLFERYALDSYLDEVADHLKKGRHQGIECYFEPKRDIRFINYIHNSTLGLHNIYHALRSGGIFFTEREKNEIDVIIDGLKLSRAMSFKNASAQVPFGGCRISDQAKPVGPGDRESIGFIAYAIDRTRSFVGPDMGFPPELVDVMKREGYTLHVTGGLDSKVGPPGIPTAFGVYLAIKEAAYARFGSLSLAGKRIIIQGLGSVGFPLVDKYLINEDADLYAVDTSKAPIEKLMAKYPGQLQSISPKAVTAFQGDIWVPCAIGGVIGANDIPQLNYAIVLGAANNTLQAENQEEEIKLAQQLGERDILFQIDWLHNTAGVISGAEEYSKQDNASYQRVMDQVEQVCREGVRQNIKTAAENGITPTEQGYRHFNSLIYR